MINKTMSRLKKPLVSLVVIAIAFLFISSTTFVQQAEGSIVNDHIDEVTQYNEMVEIFNYLHDSNNATEQQQIIASYLLVSLIEESLQNPTEDGNNINADLIQKTLDSIEESPITMDDVYIRSESCLLTLQKVIDNQINPDTPQPKLLFLDFFKNLINLILSKLFNRDSLFGNGVISSLLSILQALFRVPAMLLNIMYQGLMFLAQIVFRVIRAFISMILLIISGGQMALLIGGLFFLFLGVASKIGIKLISLLSAPFFAVITILFVLSTGTLFGGIALTINVLLGFLITFAIPIGIIAAIILIITGGEPDFNLDWLPEIPGDGLLYMIASILSSMFKNSN